MGSSNHDDISHFSDRQIRTGNTSSKRRDASMLSLLSGLGKHLTGCSSYKLNCFTAKLSFSIGGIYDSDATCSTLNVCLRALQIS